MPPKELLWQHKGHCLLDFLCKKSYESCLHLSPSNIFWIEKTVSKALQFSKLPLFLQVVTILPKRLKQKLIYYLPNTFSLLVLDQNIFYVFFDDVFCLKPSYFFERGEKNKEKKNSFSHIITCNIFYFSTYYVHQNKKKYFSNCSPLAPNFYKKKKKKGRQ